LRSWGVEAPASAGRFGVHTLRGRLRSTAKIAWSLTEFALPDFSSQRLRCLGASSFPPALELVRGKLRLLAWQRQMGRKKGLHSRQPGTQTEKPEADLPVCHDLITSPRNPCLVPQLAVSRSKQPLVELSGGKRPRQLRPRRSQIERGHLLARHSDWCRKAISSSGSAFGTGSTPAFGASCTTATRPSPPSPRIGRLGKHAEQRGRPPLFGWVVIRQVLAT